LVDAGANLAVDAARAAQVLDGVDIVGHLGRARSASTMMGLEKMCGKARRLSDAVAVRGDVSPRKLASSPSAKTEMWLVRLASGYGTLESVHPPK
jgi:hypothetical protein